MADKDLSYFLRDTREEIVTVPAPESFVDEKGKRLEMEIRVLPYARVQEIQKAYRKRKVATDSKNKPFRGVNSEVLFVSDYDGDAAINHIITEALVYPNLKDKKMMDHYNCFEHAEMPLKVFSKADEYRYVIDVVAEALGLVDKDDEDANVLIEEAKNS